MVPRTPAVGASSLRRRNVLDRYVAKINQHTRRAEFLLKDVTSIDVAIAEPQRAQFLKMLTGLGYQLSTAGATTTATGPEIRIHAATPGPQAFGIRRVTFSLQRAVDEEITQRFGPRSRLTVSPRGEATWTF